MFLPVYSGLKTTFSMQESLLYDVASRHTLRSFQIAPHLGKRCLNSWDVIIYGWVWLYHWIISHWPLFLVGLVHGQSLMSGGVKGMTATPSGTSGKEPACQCRRGKRLEFNPWVGKMPWRRKTATHSSIPSCRNPWTGEPGGLQSIG